MTFAVDWALKNSDLSPYHSSRVSSIAFRTFSEKEVGAMCRFYIIIIIIHIIGAAFFFFPHRTHTRNENNSKYEIATVTPPPPLLLHTHTRTHRVKSQVLYFFLHIYLLTWCEAPMKSYKCTYLLFYVNSQGLDKTYICLSEISCKCTVLIDTEYKKDFLLQSMMQA